MAQTGYTPILIYSSSTGGNAPAAGNLTNSTLGSELAINITDGKLFYKDNANAIQVIGWKTTPTSAGGTGLTSYTAGDTLYYSSGTALSKLSIGSSGYYMSSTGTAPQWSAPGALTKTDDTNVTLTLGGSASTALLNAASLTLGWTGQLAVGRGGTGIASYTAGDILYASGTTTLSKLAIGANTTVLTSSGSAPQWTAASSVSIGTATNLAGGAGGSVPYQSAAGTTAMLAIGTAYYMLGVNAGGTAPSWQPSATSVLTAQGDLLYASAANTLARLAKNTTASRYLSNGGTSNNPSWAQIDLSNGVTGTLPVGNGGTGITTLTAGYIPYGNGTSAFSSTANLFYGSTGLGVVNNVLTSNGGNVLGAGSNIQFAANSAADEYGMAKIQGYLLGNGSPYGDYGHLDFYTKASGSVQLTRCVRFDNNGQAFFELASTTASAANAYLNNGSSPANQLLRSTSSARYKTDIEDLQTQYSQNIYKLRPIWYRSKATADRSDWSWFGLLAEEVALVEPRLVHWTYLPSDYETKDVEYRAITKDENGNTVEKIELVPEKVLKENAVQVPDGVQYERLSVLLLAEVQKLRAEVDELKRK